MSSGVTKIEAAQAVWGPKNQWFLFLGIGLSAYIYSLDGVTTWQYLNYATSTVLEHSLSGTISTAQAIIIAVGKPLMAKLADVMGRAETFILVTVLYVFGYIVIATSDTITQIAIGEVFYAFGYTGLQMLQQIVIADMTNLRWRGLVTGLVSAPFIINNFIAAEIAEAVLPNWRWGYAMFAILVPISLAPIIIALLWAQRKAQRLEKHAVHDSRRWLEHLVEAVHEMDFRGLFLVATSLGLILLPLGLAPKTHLGWHNPGMLGMIVVGLVLFPLFILYEARVPPKPVLPMRWLKRGPILGASLIGFFDFASFFLQHTYLYSYVYVTRGWNYRYLTYFVAIQSLALTVFGIIGGAIMYATKRFKRMLFIGLIIRLIGVSLMLRARSSHGTVYQLITCQTLQGIGGGFAVISTQVSAQAAVAHADVATVTAMVLLLTEVGNSVGSAAAASIWSTYMPRELRKHVPGANETLIRELYGSITDIAMYPEGDPIRQGAIKAYQDVMQDSIADLPRYRLVLGAVILACFPPIICLFLTKDTKLTRAQNAIEHKDLAGRPDTTCQEQRRAVPYAAFVDW
ncbi:major facilitator superfamily domain-containing protein [Naematelia encephala]|uniref:Major facilitator superfamily domain-containing protein n=1 Tax=Naematelia encephala TaxID=71784 RepID=A0A1Y2AEI4_9TREE|nr:major facilitator superfamily domain-containing protein [Naematelia encephala]